VTLVGFQPVDDDGNLSRDLRPDAVTASTSTTSNPVNRAVRPAGCIQSVQALVVTDARVTVPCGLVPGASGGGLLTVDNGEIVLVGIVSTVSADLSANGVVPLDSLHELLAQPERYAHDFPVGDTRRGDSRSPDVSGRTLRS
jgi:hypothetical protein